MRFNPSAPRGTIRSQSSKRNRSHGSSLTKLPRRASSEPGRVDASRVIMNYVKEKQVTHTNTRHEQHHKDHTKNHLPRLTTLKGNALYIPSR